jgi:putative FmdB family regulatory protein
MPIFEYRCQACGTAFEAFVTAERAAACPDCQSRDLAKLLSVPGMVGGGTDRSEPSPAPAGGCGAGGASCACRANSLN